MTTFREPFGAQAKGKTVELSCRVNNCTQTVRVAEQSTMRELLSKLKGAYESSTGAGDRAAQYWADIAVQSKHPLAPLAHVPGVFAALWTPEVAPQTALTLATAGYGFVGIPKHLIHFTTPVGATAIRASGIVRASSFPTHGIYGTGVYMAAIGRPLNMIIAKQSTIPILLIAPAGTVRIFPYLVYVRWGARGVPIP